MFRRFLKLILGDSEQIDLKVRNSINYLVSHLNLEFVLIDIGAAIYPHKIWNYIAPYSIYVGFDPNLKESQETSGSSFKKSFVINKAVAPDDKDKILFYFTKSPSCSSTLKPDLGSLSDYLFSDLFCIESMREIPACSLERVINELSLSYVDWFKTDSQGIDLRLFRSLPDNIRSRVLAVDVEPGLIDAYIGEDLFVQVHSFLVKNGFWLSNLNLGGTIRMSRSTLEELKFQGVNLTEDFINNTVKKSPGWCEARYLRSIQSVMESNPSKRDFAVLWVISLLDGQFGFAVELGLKYEKIFGKDDISESMIKQPISIMQDINQIIQRKSLIKKYVGRIARYIFGL